MYDSVALPCLCLRLLYQMFRIRLRLILNINFYFAHNKRPFRCLIVPIVLDPCCTNTTLFSSCFLPTRRPIITTQRNNEMEPLVYHLIVPSTQTFFSRHCRSCFRRTFPMTIGCPCLPSAPYSSREVNLSKKRRFAWSFSLPAGHERLFTAAAPQYLITR